MSQMHIGNSRLGKAGIRKTSIRKALPVIGIAILAYLLFNIGISSIIKTLSAAEGKYIAYSLVFFVPITMVQLYKWGYLLSMQGIHVGYLDLLYSHLMGWFYGLITPGKVGSLVKAVYLKDKAKQPLAKCASSVILDRALDLFSIFSLALMSVFTMSALPNIHLLLGAAFVLIIVLFFGIMSPRMSRLFFGIVYRFGVSERIRQKISRSSDEFYSSLPGMKTLIFPYFLSLLAWVLIYTQSYVIAQAFAIQVPYLVFITIVPIASIVGLVPITISGFGTREATLVFLFSSFGVAPAAVVSFSLTAYVIAISIPLLLGLAISQKWE